MSRVRSQIFMVNESATKYPFDKLGIQHKLFYPNELMRTNCFARYETGYKSELVNQRSDARLLLLMYLILLGKTTRCPTKLHNAILCNQLRTGL